jgi:hypothetical protein
MLTLTDGYVITNKHYMLMVVNQFFENVTQPTTVEFEKKCERIYIKAYRVLKKAIPFMRKYGFHLRPKNNRLRVLTLVVFNYQKLYSEKDAAFYIIDLIERYFSEYRKYSADDSKEIVSKYFEYKQKKK